MTTKPKPRGPAADAKVLVVIPARHGSSRFPGKALADLGGRPLVVRVAENALRMALADAVVVATDDDRIAAAVREVGLVCEMTAEHATGTDRVGEVASRHDAGIILNLQGDEPLLDPAIADELVATMQTDPGLDMATCAHGFEDEAAWADPHAVKVVVGIRGEALYFSRAPIPGTFPGTRGAAHEAAMRHVGIYAFRRSALMRFVALPPTRLERMEGLEQLRALENGMRIKVVPVGGAPIGVDTPADLERVRAAWQRARG